MRLGKRLALRAASIAAAMWAVHGNGLAHELVAYENVVAYDVDVPVQAAYGGTTGLPRITLPPLPPITLPGGTTITPGQIIRHVLILKPIVPTTSGRVPALVLLSFLNGTPQDMSDFVGAARLVRDYGIWVFVPEQQGGTWNFGITSKKFSDDAAFLAALIDQAAAQYPIDPHRVYMAGFSDGALMTETFACQFPERIAGGAVVAATIHASDMNACRPSLGTPMVFFNGTADAISPYEGAQQDGLALGPSAPQVAQFWAGLSGCSLAPIGSDLPPTIDDGTTIHLDSYGNCSGGGPVLQYTINGGGHAWPGTFEFSGVLGIVTQNLDATRAMWNFFSTLSRP
jgi:polyhydroxybutyrate depolymerase